MELAPPKGGRAAVLQAEVPHSASWPCQHPVVPPPDPVTSHWAAMSSVLDSRGWYVPSAAVMVIVPTLQAGRGERHGGLAKRRTWHAHLPASFSFGL